MIVCLSGLLYVFLFLFVGFGLAFCIGLLVCRLCVLLLCAFVVLFKFSLFTCETHCWRRLLLYCCVRVCLMYCFA